MWNKLRAYGVAGKLFKGVMNFYVDSMGCVRVGVNVSEWFPVSVGLEQSYVMSPRLFNMYCIYGWCGAVRKCEGA